jgi:hypothetical protein
MADVTTAARDVTAETAHRAVIVRSAETVRDPRATDPLAHPAHPERKPRKEELTNVTA